MQYVGFWARVGAYLIDYIIISIVMVIFMIFIGIVFGLSMMGLENAEAEPDPMVAIGIGILTFILALASLLYYPLFECSKMRGTPGKYLLNMAIVREDGSRIGFWRAFWRLIAKCFSGLILMIGYMMVGWTQKKRGLHDMMAGTYVVWRNTLPGAPVYYNPISGLPQSATEGASPVTPVSATLSAPDTSQQSAATRKE